MTHKQPIRVAAIGCGSFMRQQHIQTIARSERLALHTLVDVDEAALERVAAAYRPVRRATRWQEAVADPRIDLLVVGVRPEFHPEIAQAALEAGKPVYVEKPLAPTVEACRAIQSFANRRGVRVAVGFNRRFAPATQRLAELFRASGPPISVYYRISDDSRIRPPEQAWKNEDRLLTEAVHIFDLLAYLLQSDPTRLWATQARPNETFVVLEYANGSRATLFSSPYGSLAQPKERLEAVLAHGAVEMDDYVELRTCGLKRGRESFSSAPETTTSRFPRTTPAPFSVERFAGRAYDGCDNRHIEDFAARGLAALLDLRRRYAEAAEAAGVLTDGADPEAWARFRRLLGDPPLPQINFASDKGWGTALEHFCESAAAGRPVANASAADGNRATACALAARRALETGAPVELDPRAWR